MTATYRAGSLRYTNPETKESTVYQPGDPLFSTAVMIAQEYWKNGKWLPIFEDEGNDGKEENDQ